MFWIFAILCFAIYTYVRDPIMFGIAIVFLVAGLSYSGRKSPSIMPANQKPSAPPKSREQHERELQKMMEDISPSPATMQHWQEESRQAQIDNAPETMRSSWTGGWEEYIIIDGREKVMLYNSDRTGVKD